MSFLEKLVASEGAVWLVAQRMHAYKMHIRMDGRKLAEDPSKWRESVDNGDLYVSPNSHKWRRVEVKHLTTQFTGCHDWDHKPHFMVDNKQTFDMKDPEPDVYYIFSADLKHFGTVHAGTRPHWYVEPRFVDGKNRDFYFIDYQRVIFRNTEKWMEDPDA